MIRRNVTTGISMAIASLMLTVGGAIYLLFRPQTLVMFHLADTVGLATAIKDCRAATGFRLPEWMIYSLPNALWSAAYILIVDGLLRDDSLKQRLQTVALMPLLGIVSETLQAMGLVPGTFDWLDIGAYALPYLLYIIMLSIGIINK